MLNIKLICLLLTAINILATDNNRANCSDPVIDFLLANENLTISSHNEDVEEPVLIAGIWKCGNCTDIDDSQLVYNEDNYNDDSGVYNHDDDSETQVELILQGMKCLTVSADKPGVVLRITGSCDGSAVTLHMAPSQHFIIRAYV